MDWAYYHTDALGSIRQLSDATGTVTLMQSYDPYGNVTSTQGLAESNYDFAGEWRDETGLQHLRARYMNTSTGRFTSRDTWGGDYTRPLSLNKWAYTEGNPVNYVDPSGQKPFPVWCHEMPNRIAYEDCARDYYDVVRPSHYTLVESPNDQIGCRYAAQAIPYDGWGYIEGFSGFSGAYMWGEEVAYDFTTMTRADFNYKGYQLSDNMIGVGISQYAGIVGFFEGGGFNSNKGIKEEYEGNFTGVFGGLELGLGLDIDTNLNMFTSPQLEPVSGISWGVGVSGALDVPIGKGGVFSVNYVAHNPEPKEYFIRGYNGMLTVNRVELQWDIVSGKNSPWFPIPVFEQGSRVFIVSKLDKWIDAYEGLTNAGLPGY